MQLQIGAKIRSLRKERHLTQEQLGEALGVSFQAISKWETGISLPDISYVPVLASFFGVTTDTLFDYRRQEIDAAVQAICDEAYQYRESDPARARELLQAGLAMYPDNDLLLNNLLYVMNYSENPQATIDLAQKILAITQNPAVVYDAYRFLAFAYDKTGDYAAVKAALEQIPQLYFSKLQEAAFLLKGEEKRDAAEKQKWVSLESLLQMFAKLAEYYVECGDIEKAQAQLQTALEILQAIQKDPVAHHVQNYKAYFEAWCCTIRNEN